jgi:hypothetical protein
MQDIFRFGPSSSINGRASLNFPIKDRIMFWMSDSRYISQFPINIEFTLGFPGRITGRKEGLWMCVSGLFGCGRDETMLSRNASAQILLWLLWQAILRHAGISQEASQGNFTSACQEAMVRFFQRFVCTFSSFWPSVLALFSYLTSTTRSFYESTLCNRELQ